MSAPYTIDLASILDETDTWHTYIINRARPATVTFDDPTLGGAPAVHFDDIYYELTITIANGYAVYRIFFDPYLWPGPCFWGERLRADRDAWEPNWLTALRERIDAAG